MPYVPKLEISANGRREQFEQERLDFMTGALKNAGFEEPVDTLQLPFTIWGPLFQAADLYRNGYDEDAREVLESIQFPQQPAQ